MEKASVLVIGAGLGGIATAARLACHGYQVTVVEKGERAGGRCDRLLKDGHHFDTGPTLFLMPQIFAQTFADLGERMEDQVDLRRVDPTYHIHFSDGTTLALTSDLNAMQAQLEAIEPGSFGGFLRYLNEGHLHHKLAFPHLAERNFYSLPEFLSPKNLLLLLRVKLLTKHYDNMGNYFGDHRLKAAFTFQDMYMSLSPYEAPATFSLLQHTEFADGVWFPMGGMYSIVEALTSIAESRGVRFMYNAPVERINVDGQQATGVILADGRQIQADIVIANADLPYVYRSLLPDDGMAERLERKRYTCSTVMFYWGVDKQYPQFRPHNLFLADDLRQCLDRILKDLTLADEPTFYMHTPAQIDPSLAPEGQDTLVVVVPVGHINSAAPQDWAAIQKRARQLVLQRLAQMGVNDLEEHIKFEVSYTPLDWLNRYNLAKGSTFGLGHNLMQMAYLRPRNRHARYRNLYFVGASTHPGSGMPAVLLSARFAAERVLQDAGVHWKPLSRRAQRPVEGHSRDVIPNEGSVPVMDVTAALARSITWASSKQTYYTARLMADKDLVNDCYRAYAYFRWADDIIDVSSQSSEERISFIKRQRELIDRLYKNDRAGDLAPGEEIIADLINHDRGENSGLQSFVRNFLAILEFDAHRKGRLISQQELTWYASCLGKAVTDCIQYFVGNGHPYPTTDNHYLAATAAHITHMLRDMVVDTADGYINIPREYLEAHGISPDDVDSPPFRAWVRERVDLARGYFREGKRYLDELNVLRCKIVGYWYCARFEGVLDTIERDGYILRAVYNERRKLSSWLKIAWLGVSVTLRHMARRSLRGS